MAGNDAVLDFRGLVGAIRNIHNEFASQAGRAVNVCLTLRNWLIGCYIAEFQLRGADRAAYGERLLDELASALRKNGVSSTGRRQLYGYLAFYRTYPQIVRSLTAQSTIPAEDLVQKLSYTHIEQLVALDHPLQRTFYEAECIRGAWSVRELKRQIGSLYFERSGLSKNQSKLAELVQAGAEASDSRLAIRDPYVFEFLGIKPREVMAESDLEDALLDRLQEFLVFYHRILRCHVLIELKVAPFNHEHLGQLNTYVSWYRRNIMRDGDSPPIGILLCSQKDHALVEYALAGLDNQLFVSKYQLELPAKEELQRFLEQQIKEVGDGA